MPYLERGRRVGRTQAASIFWGLVSVCFAAAACFYFWKNHENEMSANVLRDQVMILQEQSEALNSEKEKLQADMSQSEAQLKTREDFLQDKEAKLALEETQIESMGNQGQTQTQQSEGQAAVVKKFNEAVRKLAKDPDTDVVVRGGRPVLRVPSSVFFAYGDATLKPEGEAVLTQVAQALNGQLTNFELRVETFTDSEGETPTAPNLVQPVPAPGVSQPAKPPAAPKPLYASSWDLTGARAAAIAHYLREKTPLPFQNVMVIPRADYQPIVSSKEGHARNRRIELTITPVPVVFRGSVEGTETATGNGSLTKGSASSHPANSVAKPAKKED